MSFEKSLKMISVFLNEIYAIDVEEKSNQNVHGFATLRPISLFCVFFLQKKNEF